MFGRRSERRPWRAFGSALGLEVLVIGVLMAWLAARTAEPTPAAVPLSIETLLTPALERPREPERVRPPVLPPVKPLLRTPTPPAPVPTPVVAAAITPPLTPAPSPIAAPAAAPVVASAAPAQPVAPSTANLVDPAQAYNAKLTAAAQAAFEVPGAVTALAFKGRARVEFNLRDAVASSIHIVQTSGLGAMDRAALKAVQNAAFPQPPASLQGKELRYQIWVTHDTAH
jgi:protein TonB